MLTKVKKSHESSVRSLNNFNLKNGKAYGENDDDFKG